MGQGVIAHVERVIEQVLVDPIPPINPAIELNCDRSADLDLAVGPDRIVYTSNCKVRLVDPAAPGVALDEVYLRNYQEDDPLDPVGLFSPSLHPGDPQSLAGSRFADPRVLWDERNQRFWIVASEHADDNNSPILWQVAWIHVAVSKSSSPNNMRTGPTGDWFIFKFDTRADFRMEFVGIPDRPTMNTDGETLFIAVGRDINPIIAPLSEWRSVLIAIPTTPLLAGSPPPTPIWNLRLDPDDPMHPVEEDTNFHCAARTYDALPVPQTQYFLATNKHPFNTTPPFTTGIIIGQLDPDGSGGWSYSSQELPLPPAAWYYIPTSAVAPPPTGQVNLAGTSMLFWSVVRRGGSLWAVQTIARNVGIEQDPSPSDRATARWYEIVINDTGGFTVAQWGDIDPEAIYSIPDLEAYDPSISVNSVGDLAITYTISGPETVFPSLCMGRRFRANPPNTLPYHTLVRPGVATLDHFEFYWSDFSGTEVDAVGCGFWAHSLEAYDDGVNPTNPIDHYQSWTAELNLCVDDMWADFNGDAALTALDWIEFERLFAAADRRADVNADRRHDLIDAARVASALRR